MFTIESWVRRGSPVCAAALWLLLRSWTLQASDPATPKDARSHLGTKEFLAVVLAKVPPYVRWPETAFRSPKDPFVIGFLGEDPTEGLLAALVQGMRVNGREVAVRTFPTAEEVTPCQMFYVPSARAAEWEAAGQKLSLPHLLIVGETEEVAKSGGVLSVSLADRKLHVFLANARKARLEVDARLLKLAQVHR
jgi:hypothetical protein